MSRLGELTQKVDAFFARVAERHGTDMQCQTGCSDCCHVRLTITGVEAAAIRAHVASWPSDRRRDLAATGPGGPRSELVGGGDPDGIAGGAWVVPRGRGADRCAALDPAGRCKIYAARPLVCRSHGVPIRLRQGGLPVVQACHHNFTRTAPDPDCILDQTTLSATLLAVEVAELPGAERPPEPIRSDRAPSPLAERRGADRAPVGRVELAGLLAELAAI